MSDTSNTRELIDLLREKDPTAWNSLVDHYAADVYGWARKFGASGGDAADILQIVYLNVFKGIGDYTQQRYGCFRGWLRSITRNSCISFWRRNRHHVQGSGGTTNLERLGEIKVVARISESDTTGTYCDEADVDAMLILWSQVMRTAESEFTKNQKSVFDLTLCQGMDSSEAARNSGLTAANVRKIKSRILQRFRELFDAVDDSGQVD